MTKDQIQERIQDLLVAGSNADTSVYGVLAAYEIALQLATSNELHAEQLELAKRGEQRSIEALENQRKLRDTVESESRHQREVGTGFLKTQVAMMKDAGIPIPAHIEKLTESAPDHCGEETAVVLCIEFHGETIESGIRVQKLNTVTLSLSPYAPIREAIPEMLKRTGHFVFEKFTNEKGVQVPSDTPAGVIEGTLTFHSQRGVSA